jgi:hypothetical protein
MCFSAHVFFGSCVFRLMCFSAHVFFGIMDHNPRMNTTMNQRMAEVQALPGNIARESTHACVGSLPDNFQDSEMTDSINASHKPDKVQLQCNACTQAVCVPVDTPRPTCTVCNTIGAVFTCNMVDCQQSGTKEFCYMCRPCKPKQPVVMCKCNKPARSATSKKGKGFYGCPGWPKADCKFFAWDVTHNAAPNPLSDQKTDDAEPVACFDFKLHKLIPPPEFNLNLNMSMEKTKAQPGDSYTPGDGAYHAANTGKSWLTQKR